MSLVLGTGRFFLSCPTFSYRIWDDKISGVIFPYQKVSMSGIVRLIHPILFISTVDFTHQSQSILPAPPSAISYPLRMLYNKRKTQYAMRLSIWGLNWRHDHHVSLGLTSLPRVFAVVWRHWWKNPRAWARY